MESAGRSGLLSMGHEDREVCNPVTIGISFAKSRAPIFLTADHLPLTKSARHATGAYMICELPIGLALRRFRRLNVVKQCAIAEMLGVSQGCVSRWESGAHKPDAAQRRRIIQLISASAGNEHDAALKRLVECSQRPVHLICDATHQLLAASPSRAGSWRIDVSELIGRSLWPFASPEIVAAEAGLFESGWFERPYQNLELRTESNGRSDVPVPPSRVLWETLPLADGRVGRLTTTIG
jgi:transcriptional regulator with XRE-family HTH domain